MVKFKKTCVKDLFEICGHVGRKMQRTGSHLEEVSKAERGENE